MAEYKEKPGELISPFIQKFRIHFSAFDIYELTAKRKEGETGKMIQGTPPVLMEKNMEDKLFEKLGLENRNHLFYWFYNEGQKEFPLLVVKEDGVYFCSVDLELNLKRISEREFLAYISSEPELKTKIGIDGLALGLGGETKEKLEEEQMPEPEKLLILPQSLKHELEGYKEKSYEEKIEILWEFVKQGGKLKLTWEEGLPPATIEEFLFSEERKGKGDCTEFSILTYALGKELGLDVCIVSIRVAKAREDGFLEPIGHSFCLCKTAAGYYIIDGAQFVYEFKKGELDDVVNSYAEEIFPEYHFLGAYYVSSENNQVKGLYMVEFGWAYRNMIWLNKALEYGYTADYVYFALAYFSYVAGEPPGVPLAYLDKINKKDELSLWLEGVLAIELSDLKRAEEIGLSLMKDHPEFAGGYWILEWAYETQGYPEKAEEIKKKIYEKWPKEHSK
jgi:hypothetical protein